MWQEISRKIRENETVLRQCETKARDAMLKVEQLESALSTCRGELDSYVDQFTATKVAHDQTVAEKDSKVCIHLSFNPIILCACHLLTSVTLCVDL